MIASSLVASLLLTASLVTTLDALTLDPDDTASIRSVAATLARGVFTVGQNANDATGPNTQDWQVGLFPFLPYYWWENGATWGGIMDYGVYTGDNAYQQDILNAIGAQVGPKHDFVMPQQVSGEANDDQGFWVFDALTALEYDFPSLPCPDTSSSPASSSAISPTSSTTSTSTNTFPAAPTATIVNRSPAPTTPATSNCPNAYLALATNAFALYVSRWNDDDITCNGGLKWQYTSTNVRYNYKISISNGAFFNVAARLAAHTHNETYATWATRIWDWTSAVGLISDDYHVYDRAGDADGANCSSLDHTEWTHNTGVFLHGAAAMAAYSASTSTDNSWTARAAGLVGTAHSTFFSPHANATDVMSEPACELPTSQYYPCNTDQQSFKAYLARWMGKAVALVPSLADEVKPLLRASAIAAAGSCTGLGNSTCGEAWWFEGDGVERWDGRMSLGVQLAALETVLSLLGMEQSVTATTSVGNSAGDGKTKTKTKARERKNAKSKSKKKAN